MVFLDMQEPEDAGQLDDSGETDDAGEDTRELDGVEKEIDELLKDSESDASLTTRFTGTITILIARVHRGEENAEDELFHAVCDQLQETALKALAKFRGLQQEPEALIGEIFPRLFARLSDVEIKNRQHFFATAFQHFRWAILDKLKEIKKERQRAEPMTPALAGVETGPAELVEREDLYAHLAEKIDQLQEEPRKIIELRFHLGFGFREIGEELSMASSTVHDLYRKALKELKSLLGDRFEDR